MALISSLSVFWQTPRYRSLAGLAVALAILPVLLGILACLRTPVGDPEHSRIDPRLTGIWLSGDALQGDPRPSDSKATVWILEPYDARTWLITWVALGPAADATAGAAASPAESVDVLHILATLREHPPGTASVALFKAWLTTLGGQRFLVLEQKAHPTGDRPDFWWLIRVQTQGARILLSFAKTTATEHLDETTSRKQAEQIIARHAAEADFYERPAELFPVPRAGYDDVRAMLKSIGFSD